MTDAIDRLLAHIHETVGPDRDKWTKWPGGWRGEIGTALIDAVYSARAVYETNRGGGVLPKVREWRVASPQSAVQLTSLIDEIGEAPDAWASRFGNRQVAPGRGKLRPGDATKAGAIREAAENLRRIHVETADDLQKADIELVKTALRSVPGIGHATTNYFFMLLGAPGVKPDVMVHRFVRDALGDGTPVTDARADALVSTAAEHLGVEAHELDHAIWAYQRARK